MGYQEDEIAVGFQHKFLCGLSFTKYKIDGKIFYKAATKDGDYVVFAHGDLIDKKKLEQAAWELLSLPMPTMSQTHKADLVNSILHKCKDEILIETEVKDLWENEKRIKI